MNVSQSEKTAAGDCYLCGIHELCPKVASSEELKSNQETEREREKDEKVMKCSFSL